MCYIEQRFKMLADQKADGERLKTKWNADKDIYTSHTAITVFDFQHFSMHDKSHSVRILQNIELILGRKRVDALGVGDLWLLLQVAYFHDIGMSLTSDDMDELWKKDSKFRAFLRERLLEGRYRDNAELYDAIDYYQKVDRVLTQKDDFDAVWKSDMDVSSPDWPTRLIQNVQYIIAEYIRKKHAERSEGYFERIFEENKVFAEGVIEKRLYELVGTISSLHTTNFDKVFELPCEEVAMGDEHIHPRFAAAMLRIGDVLDMDNNRFNMRVLEHRGALPPKSMAHLHKHKALRHFEITQTGILASAYSKDFETCLETRNWYNWIEEEFGNLVMCWNRLVPKELKGCLLKKCNLYVYLDGKLFTTRNLNHFNFDSRKMQKLLIGDSIYDCRLDCLREYIQNAIDASKVRLWQELRRTDIYDRPIKKEGISPRDLLPCDLKESAFLSMPIEITFSYEPSGTSLADDKILVEIRDRGIGLDRTCVDGITTIGKGWRAREEYQDVFDSAPKWLQPTGGFGIGIQSAFMVTDEVIYETRSEKESSGQRIRLMSPESGGRVTREDFDFPRSHGTTVAFKVSAMKFMNYEDLGMDNEFAKHMGEKFDPVSGEGSEALLHMFNQTNILKRTIAICKEYLIRQNPNAIFPIYIGEKGTTLNRISSPYLYRQLDTEETSRHSLEMLKFKEERVDDPNSGKSYRYCFHININGDNDWKKKESRIVIWNTQFMDCVCLSFPDQQIEEESRSLLQENIKTVLSIAFKNIAVSKEKRGLFFCNTFLDIMGERAEKCLQVSRSKLKNDFDEQLKKRLHGYFRFGFNKLIPEYVRTKQATQKEIRRNQIASRLAVVVNEDDIIAGSDFVRIVLGCLTYLSVDETPLCGKEIKGIKKFGQELFDKETSELHIDQENDGEIVNQAGDRAPQEGTAVAEAGDRPTESPALEGDRKPNPMSSMLEYCVQKLLNIDASNPKFFVCTDDPMPLVKKGGINTCTNQEFIQALENILEQAGTTSMSKQNSSTVYDYLLQSHEQFFSTLWGDALFGINTELWKDYKKVHIGEIPLTIYYQKANSPIEPQQRSKMLQDVFYNDEKKYQEYPVAVSRVPFHAALQPGQWAIISPIYSTLEEKIAELKMTYPIDEESAVKRLLGGNANFCSLVDWVHNFQVPVNGQYYSKEKIRDIYLKWVLFYYHHPESNMK